MIQTKSVFTTMLVWQLLSTSIVAFAIFFISGKSAAISACLGGTSVILGGAFASFIFVRNNKKQKKLDGASVLVSLMISEMVKLIFVFVFLFLVFKHYKNLVPVALIIGLMTAALVSGVAISKIENKSN